MNENMKKVILMPDSFKGTMSSIEVCNIMEEVIHKYYPHCKVKKIPVADGGEGTVDCFLEALSGEEVTVTVNNPFFEPMQAKYALIHDGKTAVIEMASCAGLPLVEDRKDPLLTTTYGVGELILDAVKKGARNIVIGLGGSATNDAACGLLSAVGVEFKDEDGEVFIPTGVTLKDIASITYDKIPDELSEVKITCMCDIDNPPYGENGASYIFGPQKGATEEMVVLLDAGVKHFCDLLKEQHNIDVSTLEGGGAAGAMGAGIYALLGAKMEMGIDVVLDTVNFNEIAQGADVVFSGEGRIDNQSLRGKVVIGIAKRAKLINVPLIAVVGDIGDDMDSAYDMGVTSIFSINRVAKNFSEVKHRSKSDLNLTFDAIIKTIKTFE